jgi:hypothetical protein
MTLSTLNKKNDESNASLLSSSSSSQQLVDPSTALLREAKMHLFSIIEAEEIRCGLEASPWLSMEQRVSLILESGRSQLFSYNRNPLTKGLTHFFVRFNFSTIL